MKKLLLLLAVLVSLNGHAQKELWGMTYYGGLYGAGIIFKTDGSGNNYSIQQDLFQIKDANPESNLVQASDGKLYGMARFGGSNGFGVIFQYDPSTSTYTKKYDFNLTDGANPSGSLMQASDGKLYGMAANGGANTVGVIFQYDPSTSTYTKKIDFAGTNGSYPKSTFVQKSDGMLYGTTSQGGANNMGVIFQFNPVNSICTKKIDFAGTTNGSYPYFSSLIQATDGKLYGMAQKGGLNNLGVIFQYDPATSTYTKKFDFDGTANGSNPYASLMQASDGNLYGMTNNGGSNNLGVIFQYNPSTSAYTKKLDFDGAINGSFPVGSLMQALDGKLYGLGQVGGANSKGVIFQYDPSTSTYIKKFDFSGAIDGRSPRCSLIQASDGKLYGLTNLGGVNDGGVIFQYTSSTSTYTKKYDFNMAVNGANPGASLMQASDGKLYGMTNKGGVNNLGVIFQYDQTSAIYTKKLDFNDTANGANPNAFLMQASNGKLYGMTQNGGANGKGVIFEYDPVTAVYVKKMNFNGTNGANPQESLIQASDGKIYGMTYNGGANGKGVLFQYDPVATTYIKKIDFDGTAIGANPAGSLMQANDGKLYGLTAYGGIKGKGTLFQYDPTTSVCIKKTDFDSTTNGQYPFSSLIEASDGKIYGLTANGGSSDNGVIFQYDPVSTICIKTYDFNGTDGKNPGNSLMQASDGNLYGTTGGGGTSNLGVFFQYNPSTTTYTKKIDFIGTNGGSPYSNLIEIDVTAASINKNNFSDGPISAFTISPNPFTSQTSISFSEEQKNANIKIIDVLGKEIKTINFTGKELIIEKGELKSGIYFVQVIDENIIMTNKKIIVQ